MLVLIQRLRQLKALTATMKPGDIHVVERSPQSCNVFGKALQMSAIDCAVFQYVNDYVCAEMNTLPVDMCWLYIDTQPDECIARIARRNRSEELSIPLTYLQALDTNYKLLVNEQNAFAINGNQTEQRVFEDACRIIDALKKTDTTLTLLCS